VTFKKVKEEKSMDMQTKRLREVINRSGSTASVGIWDPFSAKVAEQEGFEFLNLMGSMVSWSFLGRTDSGYITLTEMLDVARRVVDAVGVPIIVDCDDGFGDPMIVRRTVQLFEQVGAAGIIVEDLKRPLRCSALGGGSMERAGVMVQKVRAALEARNDPNFVIIARTDDYEGMDEVITRVNAYGKAGADMAFVLGLKRVEDMERLGKESPIPLMAVQAPGTMIPLVPPDRLETMGYKLITYIPPIFASAALAIRNAVKELKSGLKDGTRVPSIAPGFTPMEIEQIVGLPQDTELQKKYHV
jgi:2-methylisocitrate lyase-like PEP mutase family enzyme